MKPHAGNVTVLRHFDFTEYLSHPPSKARSYYPLSPNTFRIFRMLVERELLVVLEERWGEKRNPRFISLEKGERVPRKWIFVAIDLRNKYSLLISKGIFSWKVSS